MSLDPIQTTPTDLPKLREFLAQVFRLTMATPFLDDLLLQWEYFEPRPGWPGTRSYIMRKDARIFARGCLDNAPELLMNAQGAGFTPSVRSPAMLNYILRCPAAAVPGFMARSNSGAYGHFVLRRVLSQPRVREVRLNSKAPAWWRAGYSTAAHTAAADSQTSETLDVCDPTSPYEA